MTVTASEPPAGVTHFGMTAEEANNCSIWKQTHAKRRTWLQILNTHL